MRGNRDEDKVTFVTYMLEGRALHCWKGIKRKYEHHQGPFTWAMFDTEFLTKYFPRSTLYSMQRDFSKLVQGNMTIDEYEAEFDRLSPHVSMMVPDENAQRDKFEHGLVMYIQKGIAGSNAPETYVELVDRAKKLDAVHAEARELTQANQKKRVRDSDFKGAQTSKGSAPNQPIGKQQSFQEPRGTLHVASSYAYVLFDSRATHSFVSSSFAMLHSLPVMPMNHDLCVSTPVGSDLVANSISKTCPIRICDRELVADLILLDLDDFDVILGMDWLSVHHALVNYNKKIANFEIPREERFCFEGSGARSTLVILSAMQACRLLRQGCEAFLTFVVEVESNDVRVEDIPVVNEFVDVFPEDLPGLPLDRKVEFTVDLALGTAPISKAPYWMAPVEMRRVERIVRRTSRERFCATQCFAMGSTSIVCEKEIW
ncbi:uncharacterized protein LOC143853939 [Tasmannia lanceolata]|uniref:uncharacterized protein LOC143853939 n=1 Tax=Tasmannia lanceolata TaxID=3420 RepID=UPI004063EB69